MLVIFLFTIPQPAVNKSRLISAISYNHKTLMTFHHDAPNSHVPGFNFVEFLISVHNKPLHKSA